MAERCPQCRAEYGPEDRFCPSCGSVRMMADEPADATWPVPPDAGPDNPPNADRADRLDDDADFVPLVIPPQDRGRWTRLRERPTGRALAIALVALLLIVAAGGAYLALNGGDDGFGDDDTGERIFAPPALDASPAASSSISVAPAESVDTTPTRDVARNNTAVSAPTPAGAGASGPVRATATGGGSEPTVPAATPTVSASVTPRPAVFPESAGDALATVAETVEVPTPPAGRSPRGDGTGGPPPVGEPGAGG